MFNTQCQSDYLDIKSYLLTLIPQKNHIMWSSLVVIIFLFCFYGYQIVAAYISANNVEELILEFKSAAIDRNFEKTDAILEGMNNNIDDLSGYLNRLYPITLVPGISRESDVAESILNAAKISVASGILIINWAENIPIISQLKFDSFDQIKEEDKKQVLSALADSPELWRKINEQTTLSLQFLSDARELTKIPVLSSKISATAEKLITYQEIFSRIQPWLGIAPSVLGYPTEKTYLLLLQNNTELRPTGGFIGTYGILKIRNASVTSFITDNVYNLDEPAKAYNAKIPPVPMQKYIKQSQWFFRDSNWDPDFPSSAKTAIEFYKNERGAVKHFDGVIAFTPAVVEDFLKVIGPIYVDNKEFTSENLIDVLAYHVEKGFKEEGITIYNRKKIIDAAAQQIKDKLFSLSIDQARSLAPIVFSAFDKKQLMIWFENKDAQKIAQNLNWDNRILETDKDYLYIVDANLGSLKSDPAIKRTINYSLSVADTGDLHSTAAITYEHTGDFDWKTTRYRTYARVYVPQGSTLIKAKGNEEQIAISDEHGKTVFGTFISIEPGQSETLSFIYALPKDVSSRILQGDYNLLIQKQAGTKAHDLNLDITLPYKIDKSIPSGILDKKGGNQVIGKWDLEVDREITIKQK